jgi:hypothetical protein
MRSVKEFFIELHSIFDLNAGDGSLLVQGVGRLFVLVPWEVVLLALLLHLLDSLLELLDLFLLFDDGVDVGLDLLLDVIPFNLAKLTAWVVDLTLNSDVPAVVHEILGLGNLGLDVVLEALDDLLPLLS